MKPLYQFLCEGGAAGHMAHPYDYTEYTLRELKGLIRNLFTGKIEDITEKVDGLNIVATMNKQDEVVFIRGVGDLNSPQGGMSITDMATKWADKPKVAKTYLDAGKIIKEVFETVPNKFFNPNEYTRVAVNCECVTAGKTNIIPYASAQVDFHDLFVYEKDQEGKWQHIMTTKKGMSVIERSCAFVDEAQPTPQIVIKTTDESNKILVDFIKKLDKIFKDAGCKEFDTIDIWKRNSFRAYCEKNLQWILDSEEGFNILYKRWFEADKSTNFRLIKQMYPEHVEELTNGDKKEYKNWTADVMKPIDDFFGQLGNKIISLCDGIINDGVEDQVIQQLKDEVQDVVSFVNKEGSIAAKEKLTHQLSRLEALNGEVNPVEGIVFRHNGKLMKLTGSFAALNQIINIKYMDMTK